MLLEKKKKKSTKYESKIKLNKSQRNEKYRLLTNIKSRVNKGWPTGALKLLNQKYVKTVLDTVEIDQQKELIAKGYFLANKNLNKFYTNKKPLQNENWTKRKCLCCSKIFDSWGIGNRLCQGCK